LIGEQEGGAGKRIEGLRGRTYGSLELSGIVYIIDPHIDSSVNQDAALSVSNPLSYREGERGFQSTQGVKNRGGHDDEKREEKRLTSSLIIGICSSLYASNAALKRRFY
jgi:hypothetical protein